MLALAPFILLLSLLLQLIALDTLSFLSFQHLLLFELLFAHPGLLIESLQLLLLLLFFRQEQVRAVHLVVVVTGAVILETVAFSYFTGETRLFNHFNNIFGFIIEVFLGFFKLVLSFFLRVLFFAALRVVFILADRAQLLQQLLVDSLVRAPFGAIGHLRFEDLSKKVYCILIRLNGVEPRPRALATSLVVARAIDCPLLFRVHKLVGLIAPCLSLQNMNYLLQRLLVESQTHLLALSVFF